MPLGGGGEVFFEFFLARATGPDMAWPEALLAPVVAVEQTVDISEGDLLADKMAELMVNLRRGENPSLLGVGLEARQKCLFPLPGEKGPAASASPGSFQALGPSLIVIAEP